MTIAVLTEIRLSVVSFQIHVAHSRLHCYNLKSLNEELFTENIRAVMNQFKASSWPLYQTLQDSETSAKTNMLLCFASQTRNLPDNVKIQPEDDRDHWTFICMVWCLLREKDRHTVGLRQLTRHRGQGSVRRRICGH